MRIFKGPFSSKAIECMHNKVWGGAEIIPLIILYFSVLNNFKFKWTECGLAPFSSLFANT